MEDIQDHLQVHIISCEMFFQGKITFLKEKISLMLTDSFYSSAMFVNEAVFRLQDTVG